jgi:hypothetical protein
LVTCGAREELQGRSDVEYVRRDHAANPANYGGKTLEQALDVLRGLAARQRMIGNAAEMAAMLKRRGADVTYTVFDGEDHQSVAVPALNRALRFLLRPED